MVIEGLKLPSTSRSSIYNSQYCSLFFRPWTFLAGNEIVPHLSLLGVRKEALVICYNGNIEQQNKHYKVSSKELSCSARNEKMPCTARKEIFKEISWPHAWDEYVRGNVVSASSAALITSFLLKTMVGSGEKPDAEESDADESGDDKDFPPLQLPAPQLQKLLKPAMTSTFSPTSSTLGEKLVISAKKKKEFR